jgi:pimeloyl-ACP methyl ester carboxylesterase
MAMDVIELIREKGIESNFVLLGHSMGARVVMEIAGLYPLLPKGVIAVDLAPYDYMDDPRFGIIKKTYEVMSKVSDVDLNRRIEEIKNDIYKLTESREIGDLMLASIEHLSEKKYRWKMNIHGILSNYF